MRPRGNRQRRERTGWAWPTSARGWPWDWPVSPAAYAVARIGSAAIGAVSEKPELMGRTLVFLGLAEGIAIYGLIIAIMILNKL